MKALLAVLAIGVATLFAQEAYGQFQIQIGGGQYGHYGHGHQQDVHLQLGGLHLDIGNPHYRYYNPYQYNRYAPLYGYHNSYRYYQYQSPYNHQHYRKPSYTPHRRGCN